jgi:DNA-binding IclR family transcriptional regulator
MPEKTKGTTSSNPRKRRPPWAMNGQVREETPSVSEERYYSRTIERALDVLEVFGPGSSLSLKQIAASTDQPEASLYRVLVTLQKRGYLAQKADGTYELARKVLYGRVLDEADRIRKQARPVLDELARRFDETASVSYFFGTYIQVLDSVETFQSFRVANRPGRILPPHCSAMGKSILAFQPDEAAGLLLEAYGLTRRTEHSICDRQALREELERVRKQRWACDREESTLGGVCFGAPIFDSSGRAVAALSISSPVQRMTAEREKQIQQAVHEAAGRLSAGIGGTSKKPKGK